jgi:hypothetical protein
LIEDRRAKDSQIHYLPNVCRQPGACRQSRIGETRVVVGASFIGLKLQPLFAPAGLE